jgi:hypothetical protein
MRRVRGLYGSSGLLTTLRLTIELIGFPGESFLEREGYLVLTRGKPCPELWLWHEAQQQVLPALLCRL